MDQAHARALLAGERARLERLLAAESQEPDAADLGDEVDDADRRDDRQTGRAVDELLGTRWAALEWAAARLAAGSYGRSVRSGRPLPDERLEADPLAELTVEEAAAAESIETRLGLLSEPYRQGSAGRLLRTGRTLTLVGALGALLGGRGRLVSALSGAALLAAAAATRFGIYAGGVASMKDPRYTVVPQRERLDQGRPARADDT
jgi:RNA polymerase-binding transcription factor DksA